MKKIMNCLWFDTQAEEATKFYASVFRNTKLGEVVRAPAGGEPYTKEGQVLTAEVTIEGMTFILLNGGPHPEGKPNDSVSFQIMCKDQAEVDEYWNRLAGDGGKEVQCGWVKDKYGLSWQLVPVRMMELMSDPDPARARRAMEAMMEMKTLDIAAIEKAAGSA